MLNINTVGHQPSACRWLCHRQGRQSIKLLRTEDEMEGSMRRMNDVGCFSQDQKDEMRRLNDVGCFSQDQKDEMKRMNDVGCFSQDQKDQMKRMNDVGCFSQDQKDEMKRRFERRYTMLMSAILII
ncbi:hypothetical protein AVEN_179692-1 [Araneus ventricosus]|uniref:Uncharacterized protein n=1 Tax=Araneus ventricosus TaxID=182803 RepID=A0A4Y2M1J9_ARAVE|nr:hypothetical protein AVEN_232022-1 [Araneus ventricosus]GBN20971.1 hypothetical protein AVEN_179692-1 [Araneus ventricosus]